MQTENKINYTKIIRTMKKLFIALIAVMMGGMAVAQTHNERKGMTEWTGSFAYEFGNYYGKLAYANFSLDCRYYITNTFSLGGGIGFGQYSYTDNNSPASYDSYPELMAAISMRKTFEGNSTFMPYLGMRAGVLCDPAFGNDFLMPMAHAGIGVEYNVSRRNGLMVELGYTVSEFSSMGLSFGLRF